MDIKRTTRRAAVLVATCFCAAALGGCTQNGTAALTQGVGGVLGGTLGGYAGAQFGSGTGQIATTALGSGLGGLFGSFFGGQVGSGLGSGPGASPSATYSPASYGPSATEGDAFHIGQAQATAATLPLGGTVSWFNPDTGSSGSVTPVRDGRSASGQSCRQFEQVRSANGRAETVIQAACQSPDGRWLPVN